jgi:ribosomal protein S18 acetylase RimI-like enzyme
MTAALRLRAATRADLPRLAVLLRDFYAEEQLAFDAARADAALAALVDAPAHGALLLADVDGEVAGYAVLGWCFSLEQGGRHALVDELYLVPGVRGRGLGRALLDAACAHARAAGAPVARLEVNHHNARAKALYTSMGFVDDRRDLLTRRLDGRP